jgi:hypothetical protein
MRPQREELLQAARGREIDRVLVGGWTARTETRPPYELENITPCIGRDSSGLVMFISGFSSIQRVPSPPPPSDWVQTV